VSSESVTAFLGAIAAVESPLKFWAFIGVVFLALAIAFFRSNALHKTWAKVVGEDLSKNHRFKVIRLVTGGLLFIAVLALVLAFVAPLMLRRMDIQQEAVRLNAGLATYAMMLDGKENESVQRDFASAMEAFNSGDYTTARRRMLSLQRQVVSKQSLEALQGLITATYYARKEHLDGIRFICDQYHDKPKWDARFRYQFHAHIRRIAINEGYEDAEKVVASFRPRCNRGDLSPVWAGIPLGAIERLVAEGFYLPDLDDADKAYLRYAMDRYSNDAMLDHALLFLDQDEELLRRYPDSMLALAALERVARRRYQAGDNQAAVQFAERYLQSLTVAQAAGQPSVRTSSVVDTLGGAYLELGRVEDARKLGEKFRDPAAEGVPSYVYSFARSQMDKVMRAADLAVALDKAAEAGYPLVKAVDMLPSLPPGLVTLLRDGGFADASGEYKLATTILEARKVALPERWGRVGKVVVLFAENIDAATPAQLLESGIQMRQQAGNDNTEWEMLPLLRGFSLGLWKRCIYRDPQSVEAMKAGYLRGATLRREGSFRDAANEFTALVARHANGDLTDDALAELVSYNVQVLDDDAAAKQYMEKLATEFPLGNAVDNALYMLGNFYRFRHDYAEAAKYYSAVAVNYGERRLGIESHQLATALGQAVASQKPRMGIKGLRFQADADDVAPETGTYVDAVDTGSSAAGAGFLPGDHVKSVAGHPIETVAQFYQALANAAPGSMIEFTLLRGFDEKLVTLRAPVEQENYYAKSLTLEQ
jgi:TolA-binding protein